MEGTPSVAPSLRPVGGYGLLSRVAARILQRRGWQVEVMADMPARCIIVAYPHTSNWDFVVGVLTKWAVGLSARHDALHFIGKESLFKWPWGIWFRAIGGLPVVRSHSTGFVEQTAAQFASRAQLRLAIAPEGTRSYRPYMRSSFYYVALQANVPLLLAGFDFAGRRILARELLHLSGDVTTDLQQIQAYYDHNRIQGKHPQNACPWLFKT